MVARQPIPLLRTTERGTFAECQWRWFYSYVLGYEPTRTPTWSWFGRAIHAALAVRYPVGRKRGSLADVLAAFDAALGEEVRRVWTAGAELDEEEVVDARTLGRQMLRGYVQTYGRDVHWEVLVGEQPMQIDVPDPRNPDRIIAVYCLTLDMVVWDRVDKVVRVVDHKTRRSFPADGKWGFYELNRQAGAYLWVTPELLRHLGLIRKSDQVDGIIFNCLKKSMPTERILDTDGVAHNKPRKEHYIAELKAFLKTDGNEGKPWEKHTLVALEAMAKYAGLTVYGDVSAVQPAPLYHRHTTRRGTLQRVRQAQHVAVEARQMRLLRRGVVEPIKNTTEACPRCTLYELCLADEISKADGEEIARYAYKKRDPYADHRLDMQEKDGVWVHPRGGKS